MSRRQDWYDRTAKPDGTFTDPPTAPPASAPILSADHEQAERLARRFAGGGTSSLDGRLYGTYTNLGRAYLALAARLAQAEGKNEKLEYLVKVQEEKLEILSEQAEQR